MPAITADTLTLPRIASAGPSDTERPVRSITTGPRGYEGEGFPVVRAFAGVSSRRPGSVRAYGSDGRGRIRTRRAQRHRLASAPRVRDRHVHARRTLRPPGLPRRRWADHRRRHAMDDGRIRDPAHRDSARRTGREWRFVPRHPVVGEPAAQGQVRDTAVSGHRGRRGQAAVLAGRWGAGPSHCRRHRRACRARCHPHSNHHGAQYDRAGRQAEHSVESRLQRARLRAVGPRCGRSESVIRFTRDSWPCSGLATGSA